MFILSSDILQRLRIVPLGIQLFCFSTPVLAAQNIAGNCGNQVGKSPPFDHKDYPAWSMKFVDCALESACRSPNDLSEQGNAEFLMSFFQNSNDPKARSIQFPNLLKFVKHMKTVGEGRPSSEAQTIQRLGLLEQQCKMEPRIPSCVESKETSVDKKPRPEYSGSSFEFDRKFYRNFPDPPPKPLLEEVEFTQKTNRRKKLSFLGVAHVHIEASRASSPQVQDRLSSTQAIVSSTSLARSRQKTLPFPQLRILNQVKLTLDRNPDVLILEIPLPPDPIQRCKFLLRNAMTPDSVTQRSEGMFAMKEAVRRGIPVVGGEPSDEQVIQLLSQLTKPGVRLPTLNPMPTPSGKTANIQVAGKKSPGFEPPDYAYFQVLQIYAGGVCESIDDCIQQANQRLGQILTTKLTVQDMKAWYRLWNGKDIPLLARSRPSEFQKNMAELYRNISPLGVSGARSIGTPSISRFIGEIRDAHVRGQISKQVKTYDRVQVIYGRGHLYQNLKSLEHSLPGFRISKAK